MGTGQTVASPFDGLIVPTSVAFFALRPLSLLQSKQPSRTIAKNKQRTTGFAGLGTPTFISELASDH